MPRPGRPKLLNEYGKRLVVRTATKDAEHLAMSHRAIAEECKLPHVNPHTVGRVLKQRGVHRITKKRRS